MQLKYLLKTTFRHIDNLINTIYTNNINLIHDYFLGCVFSGHCVIVSKENIKIIGRLLFLAI